MARLYIGNLNDRIRERDIEKNFKRYGYIREVTLKNGYGFLEFEEHRDAEDAVRELDGTDLLGTRLHVEHARSSRGFGSRGGGERSRDFGGSSYRGSFTGYSGRSADGRVAGRFPTPMRTDYRIIVSNLSSRVSWQDLKDHMRRAGDVTFADAHKVRQGEGVVDYSSRSDLQYAIEKLDGTELQGRRIKVTMEGRGGPDRRKRSRSRSRSRRRRSRSRSRSPRRRSESQEARSRDRSRSRSVKRGSSSREVRRAGRSRTRSPRERSPSKDHNDRSTSGGRRRNPVSRRKCSSRSASKSRSQRRESRSSPSRSRSSSGQNGTNKGRKEGSSSPNEDAVRNGRDLKRQSRKERRGTKSSSRSNSRSNSIKRTRQERSNSRQEGSFSPECRNKRGSDAGASD